MTDQPTIATALAELQTQLPHIGKTAEAQYGKYADLPGVSEELLPIMGKLGLSFSAKVTTRKGEFGLRYKLRLAGCSEVEKGFWPLPKGTPQQVGSAVTYYRRYLLTALTGAAPIGDDDDGVAGGQAKVPAPAKRVRTAHSDPEHQRLQHRRQPGDRPAARGPVPPSEDLWAGQPSGEYTPTPTSLPDRRQKPHTPAQLIAMHWHRLGITDDDERLNWTARMAGRTELASTTNLPPAQQQEILAALGGCKDIGQVQAWIDDKVAVS